MKNILLVAILFSASSSFACPGGANGAKCSSKPEKPQAQQNLVITENKSRACQKEALTILNTLTDIDETLAAGAPRVKEVKNVEVLEHYFVKSQITYTWVNDYKMVSIRLNNLGEGSGNCTVDFMTVRRINID